MSYPNLPHDHGGDVSHVVEHMPKGEAFQVVADVFKLMDDTSRIRIFWLLCHCEECVINISAIVDMLSLIHIFAYGMRARALGERSVFYKRRVIVRAVVYTVDLEHSLGQRSGLVKYHYARLAECFQVVGTLDEHALFAGPADTGEEAQRDAYDPVSYTHLQNIVFAIGIKLACLVLVAFGAANMWLAIFADVGVMILAVLNAISALFSKNV